MICRFEYLNLLLNLSGCYDISSNKVCRPSHAVLLRQFITNTDKEVTEKYKYVGILSDELPKLNCNKRKINLKLNNR